jgi:hypothetical protein
MPPFQTTDGNQMPFDNLDFASTGSDLSSSIWNDMPQLLATTGKGIQDIALNGNSLDFGTSDIFGANRTSDVPPFVPGVLIEPSDSDVPPFVPGVLIEPDGREVPEFAPGVLDQVDKALDVLPPAGDLLASLPGLGDSDLLEDVLSKIKKPKPKPAPEKPEEKPKEPRERPSLEIPKPERPEKPDGGDKPNEKPKPEQHKGPFEDQIKRDPSGRVTEVNNPRLGKTEIFYNDDGSVGSFSRNGHTFAKVDGKWIEPKFDPQGLLPLNMDFQIDKDGIITQTLGDPSVPGKNVFKSVDRPDGSGGVESSHADGSFTGWDFDKNGKITRMIEVSKNGRVTKETTF